MLLSFYLMLFLFLFHYSNQFQITANNSEFSIHQIRYSNSSSLSQVIINGKIQSRQLQKIGKNEQWLYAELNSMHQSTLENIRIAEADEMGQLYLYFY